MGAGDAGQPLSEDVQDRQSRHSGSMPLLTRLRSRITRKFSSDKDTPKINAAAQQAVAAY